MRLFLGLFVLTVHVSTCFGGFNDGGVNGNYDSNFNTGGAFIAKILAALQCSVASDPTDKSDVRYEVAVYENDENFLNVETGMRESYNSCVLYDHKSLVASNERIWECDIPTLTDDTSGRTWYKQSNSNDLSSTDTEANCGMWTSADGTKAYVAVRCHRVYQSDSLFDAIHILGCDLNNLVSRELTATKLNPMLPPKLEQTTKWQVDFHSYSLSFGTSSIPVAKKTTPGSNGVSLLDNSSVRLGQAMYFEISLSVDNHERFFAEFMGTPVGVYMTKLELTYSYTSTATYPTSDTVVMMDNGCSTAQPPYFFSMDKEYILKYMDDGDSNTASDNLFTPNSQRTMQAEVMVPWRQNVGNVDIKVKAYISYCLRSDDENCFYPFEGTQPGCDTVDRKKRADAVAEQEYPDSWPRELYSSFTVEMNFRCLIRRGPGYRLIKHPDTIIQKGDLIYEHDKSECFEKTTFFAITCVLGVLLLVVFAVALLLFMKIRSNMKDDSSSMEGFRNKAYN